MTDKTKVIKGESETPSESTNVITGASVAALFLSACDEKAPGGDGDPVGSKGHVRPVDNRPPTNQVETQSTADTQGVTSISSVEETPPTNTGSVGVLTAPPPRFQSLKPGTNNRITLQVTDMANVSMQLSDGNTINVWSFYQPGRQNRGFNGDRITPAPTLEVIQNTTVQLQLSSMHPHTIHLHGLDVDQANDGVPSTSGYVSGGAMPMPTPPVVGLPRLASPFTYVFTPQHAGTYMYHCHVDTVLHIARGMVGTIIVRPDDGNASTIWSGGPSFDREYIWHLHTFDSQWHRVDESGPETVRFRPNYFLINGKEGIDLLSDPVTALHAFEGEVVLVRAVNTGFSPANISLDGIPFRVVSSDGRPLQQAIETQNFTVYPGERYDLLFTMPPLANHIATVNYYNISETRVVGSALTSLTAV